MASDRIKSWPTKERPREKLLAMGAETQTDGTHRLRKEPLRNRITPAVP